MPTINPGDTYFSKLPDGRYERCVLQLTTEETPDRHEAARGGTGEFYRVLATKDLPSEQVLAIIEDDTNVMIWDLDVGGFVYLQPER